MENDVYAIAFAEVYEILKIMDEKDLKKIPDSFKNFIKESKSNDYIPKINKNIPLHEQDLKQETLAICALIYREYLVSSEKREELNLKDKENLIQIEKDLRKKYNPNKIF